MRTTKCINRKRNSIHVLICIWVVKYSARFLILMYHYHIICRPKTFQFTFNECTHTHPECATIQKAHHILLLRFFGCIQFVASCYYWLDLIYLIINTKCKLQNPNVRMNPDNRLFVVFISTGTNIQQ